MPINESGRKKLFIVKLLERRKVGEAEVQEFSAKVEGEEATGKHGVWARALDEYVKADTTIDCDVLTKKSDKSDPDGNAYWNRKVTQIYVDGKPVAEKKQFGGGYQRQTSEAELKAKAKNTALMQGVEIAKFSINHENAIEMTPELVLAISERLYQWLTKDMVSPLVPSSTLEKQQPVVTKGEFATSPPAKTESKPVALNATAIYNRLTNMVEFKVITANQVKEKLVELGAIGEKSWPMTQSLSPDKLAEVQKWIDEISKGPF